MSVLLGKEKHVCSSYREKLKSKTEIKTEKWVHGSFNIQKGTIHIFKMGILRRVRTDGLLDDAHKVEASKGEAVEEGAGNN